MHLTDLIIDKTDAGTFDKARLLYTSGAGYLKIYIQRAAGSTLDRPAFLLSASITGADGAALAHPLDPDDFAVSSERLTVSLSLTEQGVPEVLAAKPAEKSIGVIAVEDGRLWQCIRVDDLAQPFDGDPANLDWVDFGPVDPDAPAAWCELQVTLVGEAHKVAEKALIWHARTSAMAIAGLA